MPFISFDPTDEKNGEGNDIALRNDLADELREWLGEKLSALQREARRLGKPIPVQLPLDHRAFRVPDKLVNILNKDLKLAGIPKVDDRGYSIDVHALRHSFGSLLSKGGVSPRTAQAAMRHSTIDLTMNTYTDPRVLDVHGALDVLPAMPISGEGHEVQKATGTTDDTPDSSLKKFAPGFAPRTDNSGTSVSFGVDDDRKRCDQETTDNNVVSVSHAARNVALSRTSDQKTKVETKGLEPSTPGLQSRCSPN